MHKYLKLLIALLLVANLSAKESTQPNIIFLLSDDHQAMAMGCMGNTEIETPNMDKLADKGILFQRCYATSPLCMASRASIMSGMYEYKTGCNFKTGFLSTEVWKNQSYPMMLKKAGYTVAFAGKWGFNINGKGKQAYKAANDFDKWGGLLGGQGYYATEQNPAMKEYAEKYPHVTRALGAFGQDFIKESKASGKPFCLSLSFKAPHRPHNQIDIEDQKRYAYKKFSYPEGWGPEGAKLLPIQAKLGRQFVQRGQWDLESVYQEHIKGYYQLISGVDAAIGMVLKTLKEEGIADNTIIIYSADNGYFCGVHGLQGKVLPYEHASRVPLIIYDPRAPQKAKGVKTPAIAANIDFAPTMLDIAGIQVPKQMDGKSLLPIINASEKRVRESLGLVQNWDVSDRDMTKGLAIVTEKHKYIHWCYADKNVPLAEELFDLSKDPNELNNVISNPENKNVLKDLQQNYDEFLQHWVDNAVDGPHYARYKTIYSRHINWKEKEYRTDPAGGFSTSLKESYQLLTGEQHPDK